MSGSIIGSILDVIPAALSLRYIYRLYRNFLEDCFRCDISLEFRGICILRTDEKECSVCRLLEIFSNLESYEELETRCSVNGLLRCRCIELHKMLENRTPLIEKIKKHHQNVSWQLSRLYRMRNDIAHSARSDGEYLVKYNEHLMEYLYSFVAEIIYYLSNPDHHVQTMNDVQITFQNRYYMFGILADAYEKKRKKGKDTTYEDRMMENLCKTGVVSIPTELLENTGSCSSLGIIHGKRI